MELEVANNLIFEDIYCKQSLFNPIVTSNTSQVNNLYIGSIDLANRIAR